MATEWVDFKKVKEIVSMQMVLDHYGVKGLTKSGDELRGPCPIHNGSKRSKNFTVNLRKNAFNCFSESCRARGNILDFVSAMEQCSVRDSALKLQDWFAIGESEAQSEEQDAAADNAVEVQRGIYHTPDGALYEVLLNAISAEDLEPVVVYRELFGDYQFLIASPQNFISGEADDSKPGFELIKAL